jgi:hypothetical protein
MLGMLTKLENVICMWPNLIVLVCFVLRIDMYI